MSASRIFLFLGSVSALIGVAAGAFGAHAARSLLEPAVLEVFETAARYQLLHAIALCIVALVCERDEEAQMPLAPRLAGVFFVLGTFLFSGALYLYSLAGVRAAAIFAPFGGASFIAGWACLAWAALRSPRVPGSRSRKADTRSRR